MEQASSRAALGTGEEQWLRQFAASNQPMRWHDWGTYGGLAFFFVSWMVGCQMLFHWLPAYLEARGLVVCLRHTTLHRGALWMPDRLGFAELFGGPAAFGTIFGLVFGMMAWTCYVQQRNARRVSRILLRVLSEPPAA